MPRSPSRNPRTLFAGIALAGAVAAAAPALTNRPAGANHPGHRGETGPAPHVALGPERAWVDRIESGRAVLLLGAEGRETVTIPARLLPSGTREGAALNLTLTPTFDAQSRAQVDTLMGDLAAPSAQGR